MSLPNPFFFLQTNPWKEWNESQFEAALEAECEKWRRAADQGDIEKYTVQEHLRRLGEIRRIMVDPKRRCALAAEAQASWSTWQQQEQEFESRLAQLCSKGYLLDSEMEQLLTDYGTVLGALEIRLRAAVSLRSIEGSRADPVLGEGEWRENDDRPSPAEPFNIESDIVRAPHPKDEILALSDEPDRPPADERIHAPKKQQELASSGLQLWAKKRSLGIGGLIPVGITLLLLLLSHRGLLPTQQKRAAALAHAPTSPAAAPRPLVSPSSTAGVASGTNIGAQVNLLLRHRQDLWNASLSCACNRNLDAVETGTILQNNLRQIQEFASGGKYEVVLPRNWKVDWVRTQSPDVLLVQVSRSASETLYQGSSLVASGTWTYQEVYRVLRQGTIWKVDRRQMLSKTGTHQAGPTGVTAPTARPDEASAVSAVKAYLEIWKAALHNNDASVLPSVLTGDALVQARSILENNRARRVRQDITDIEPPMPDRVTLVDATHAAVTVRRHFSDLIVDTATGARDPSSDPNVSQVSTYSLIWKRQQWKVFERQG